MAGVLPVRSRVLERRPPRREMVGGTGRRSRGWVPRHRRNGPQVGSRLPGTPARGTPLTPLIRTTTSWARGKGGGRSVL